MHHRWMTAAASAAAAPHGTLACCRTNCRRSARPMAARRRRGYQLPITPTPITHADRPIILEEQFV